MRVVITCMCICFYFQINGKTIQWKHLTDLWERDRLQSGGLSQVPKLRFEHVHLTPFAKMRVDLATQVSTYYTNFY